MKSAKHIVTSIRCDCNDENHIHYEMHRQIAVSNALFMQVTGEVEWISLRNTPKLLHEIRIYSLCAAQ
jgi:hypothetical protein